MCHHMTFFYIPLLILFHYTNEHKVNGIDGFIYVLIKNIDL
jgi:hypothetical protein